MTAHNRNQNNDRSERRTNRRPLTGLAGAATVALTAGAMLGSAGTAAAAPGIDDMPVDSAQPDTTPPFVLPDDFYVPLPPVMPTQSPLPPVVPSPDSLDDLFAPEPSFTLPEVPDFDVTPLLPDDMFPPLPEPEPEPMPPITLPDDVVPDFPDFDDFDPLFPDDIFIPTAPECNDYSAANYGAAVNTLSGSDIEIRVSYTDDDVCDYSVMWALRAPGAGDVRASGMVPLPDVASSTTADSDYSFGIDNTGLCEWEVHISVEGAIAEVFPGMHDDCDPEDGDPEDGDPEDGDPEDGDPEDGDPEDGDPEDGEPEDGDPEDGDPEDGDPEDGDPEDGDPEDGDPEDGDPEDGDPEDGDDAPVPTTPAPETPEDDQTPEPASTPTSRLPQTGSNATNVLLGGGLVALGLGSAIAIATRRRDDEVPA